MEGGDLPHHHGKHLKKSDREFVVRLLRNSPVKYSIRQVAGIVGKSTRTVARVVAVFDETGAIPATFSGGRRFSFYTDEEKTLLQQFVDEHSDSTLQEVATESMRLFHKRPLSLTTIRRLVLFDFEYTLKRVRALSRSRNTLPTLNARATYVEMVNAALLSHDILQDSILYLDESGFNLHLRRTRGRAKRGHAPYVEVPTQRGANISFCGAMSRGGLFFHCLRTGAFRSTTFIEEVLDPLWNLLLQSPNWTFPVWVVMDNCPFHHSHVVVDWFEDHPDVRSVYLPPYSPFLNPIEEMFNWLKNSVKAQISALGSQTAVVTRDLILEFVETAAAQVSPANCLAWVDHSSSFFVPCAAHRRIRTERSGAHVVETEAGEPSADEDEGAH
jgi:transposase